MVIFCRELFPGFVLRVIKDTPVNAIDKQMITIHYVVYDYHKETFILPGDMHC